MNKVKQQLYKDVFETDKGQEVLRDLEVFCGYNRISHVPGDACTTAYNEGMRRVVLRIISFLKEDRKEDLEELIQYDIEDITGW